MNTQLVRPDARYKTSYLEAVQEFITDGHHRYADIDLLELEANFASHIAHQLRIELEPPFVPHTNYWLVEGDDFIGRISLRHHLNDFLRRFGGHIGYETRPLRRREGHGRHMLALLLPKARELGLDRVMLTCDQDNIGSRRIIEANGGVMEDLHSWPEVREKPYFRFWIMLGDEVKAVYRT